MSSICSASDFEIEDLDYNGWCPICCREDTPIRVGWTHERCIIGNCIIPHEGFMGSIAMRRRERLGLTRRQMSEITGLKPSTIKRYEWVRCSKNYYEKTAELMRSELGR